MTSQAAELGRGSAEGRDGAGLEEDVFLIARILDGQRLTAEQRAHALKAQLSEYSALGDLTTQSSSHHMASIASNHSERVRAALDEARSITDAFGRRVRTGGLDLAGDLRHYWADRAQRAVLYADTIRERGDIFLVHEAAGCPPVLIYDYDVIMDGVDQPRPTNYVLLKIRPPAGMQTFDWKRPYIIIDPRAGQGAGIGGSQMDSQVGVALRDGHPVYFVSFRREPEPGQTLADVTRTEAAFVRYVQSLHPKSAKPVVIGNCQGGWATLLLGASNPDITGPLVLNGAPVETWSGEIGRNIIRYNAGLLGGQILPMFWSDIGNGVFDGAWLVLNFELMNPGRNYFRKYYDYFNEVDTGRGRFLEFEKWWGGFFLMNEEEIVWIVRDLFIGNRLARNEARLEHGRNLDVKQIRSPVIVFTSLGDTITPPKQALNWIVDTYADETEIRIRGQRIIYMVHEKVGHLGIFVSSSIAKREHTEVASTMKTIEALAPGLYEMKIEDIIGEGENQQFSVSFAERKMSDLPGANEGRRDEVPFAAVARISELQADFYDIALRPVVQSGVTQATAELARTLHPLRLQRSLLSSRNPLLQPIELLADMVGDNRTAAGDDNLFVRTEHWLANAFEQSVDIARDLRNAWCETLFFSIYATPYMRWFGRRYEFGRTRKSKEELFALPEVQSALSHIGSGGYVEAVIRMLILLADSRGNVRRDRLERSTHLLNKTEPFSHLAPVERARVIHEQSLTAQFAREEALERLPDLLHTEEEREQAMEAVQFVLGPLSDASPNVAATFHAFRRVLGLKPALVDVAAGTPEEGKPAGEKPEGEAAPA
ncbi:pimeloyl-ACP methyl ester carboxylesterase [Pseudochelatococcus lubricantis]|uniref:Pimeloyl-ACP methyl ester carboxylesterase n=1 Tax=Pseudochelatococcus lubricantis TaxID=1538102 RepID=A0ABX0UYQ9_9HYPH|nr:DUF3141 domain-containing protein [Pseudochelatococcus lubricantis]NIJ58066.1 pimeloyl-ACP methyl ester carboxylesterase [Pseudochelatococcus lubricantis]